MTLPKVTVGFVNCNRLHYLKACIESFILCTESYDNKEFIVVDNASVEKGTEEYLQELQSRGFTVIRREARDPANEFAKGLNTICELATGEYVMLLQADMQFVLRGDWLQKYVELAATNENVGCITLDAQRNITNASHMYSEPSGDTFKFLFDHNRPPIMGAGDVFYSRRILDMVLPWQENNRNHEGGQDSETAMLMKVNELLTTSLKPIKCAVPVVPPAIAIYTDPRGTNARVRGNRRYGVYTAPVSNNQYYNLVNLDSALAQWGSRAVPVGIEEIAIPNGWNKMLDFNGNWLKNPIKPELAQPGDWEDLPYEAEVEMLPPLQFEDKDKSFMDEFDAALRKGERLAASVDKQLRKMEEAAYMKEWLEDGE